MVQQAYSLLVCPLFFTFNRCVDDNVELDGEEVRAVEETKENREIRGAVKGEKVIRSLSGGWST